LAAEKVKSGLPAAQAESNSAVPIRIDASSAPFATSEGNLNLAAGRPPASKKQRTAVPPDPDKRRFCPGSGMRSSTYCMFAFPLAPPITP
jgi:hypothetical protein